MIKLFINQNQNLKKILKLKRFRQKIRPKKYLAKNKINSKVKLEFIRKNGGNYYLLPATWRFLDLFLELAAKDENETIALNEKEDEVDDDQDDEEDA